MTGRSNRKIKSNNKEMESLGKHVPINTLDIMNRKYHRAKGLLYKAEKEIQHLQKLVTMDKTPIYRANILKYDFILSFS